MAYYGELAQWNLLHPDPNPGWDKPTRYRIPAVAGTTRPVAETGNHERDGKRLF